MSYAGITLYNSAAREWEKQLQDRRYRQLRDEYIETKAWAEEEFKEVPFNTNWRTKIINNDYANRKLRDRCDELERRLRDVAHQRDRDRFSSQTKVESKGVSVKLVILVSTISSFVLFLSIVFIVHLSSSHEQHAASPFQSQCSF